MRTPSPVTLAVLALAFMLPARAGAAGAGPATIAVPGGEAGVGYDDLQYAPELKRVLAPAGRTGRLVLVDPATRSATAIGGFSAVASFRGGHGEGTTSAAAIGGGLVVATDRGTRSLRVADVAKGGIVGGVALAGPPDYVRWVARTGEVWVTEPARKQIEILRVERAPAPRLVHVTNLPVPDGPESLVIDGGRGRAYTHAWAGETYAIELDARKIVATWRNGCRGSRGIALDGARGLLFTGCAEGKATVVSLATARVVASAPAGGDVDSIGFAATLSHLYVPSGARAEVTVFAVSSHGALTALGTLRTAADAHTVAFDPGTDTLFVGTPAHGAILALPDRFPLRSN